MGRRWRAIQLGGDQSGPNVYGDDYYRRWPLPIDQQEIDQGIYLKSLNMAESFAAFLSARGHCLEDNRRIVEARESYADAIAMAPHQPMYQVLSRSHLSSTADRGSFVNSRASGCDAASVSTIANMAISRCDVTDGSDTSRSLRSLYRLLKATLQEKGALMFRHVAMNVALLLAVSGYFAEQATAFYAPRLGGFAPEIRSGTRVANGIYLSMCKAGRSLGPTQLAMNLGMTIKSLQGTPSIQSWSHAQTTINKFRFTPTCQRLGKGKCRLKLDVYLNVRLHALNSGSHRWNDRLPQYDKWGVPRTNAVEREAAPEHERDHVKTMKKILMIWKVIW